jgi:flagellar capping protein FliD
MNPNAVMGLGSKLNTSDIIDRFIKIEKRRLQPVEQRKEEKLQQVDAWAALQTEISKLKDTVDALDRKGIWEAKKITSSEPDVVTVAGGASADPGKTTIAIDSIATAHQLNSPGFESKDAVFGAGVIKIQVGEEDGDTPIFINVTEENNTLEGIRDAINDSGAEVEAFVAETYGNKPFRLLLTSQRKGAGGAIQIEVKLESSEENTPVLDFSNKYDETAEWEGVIRRQTVEDRAVGKDLLTSTPITEISGDYTGDEDNTFTFNVIKAGVIPGEQDVIITWEDQLGRGGEFSLNKYNYKPGDALELADGLSLRLSQGEVVNGDSFEVNAHTSRSPSLWWLNEAERAPRVDQPAPWQTVAEGGSGLNVFGEYIGEEEDTVIFRIEGSGQVGGSQPLYLHYEYEESGETGKLKISEPYFGSGGDADNATAYDAKDGEELFNLKFGNGGGEGALSIGNGLSVKVPPSLVSDGATAKIEVTPKSHPDAANFWWNENVDGENTEISTGSIDEFLEFEVIEIDEEDIPEEEVGKSAGRYGSMDQGIQTSEESSTANVAVTGNFMAGENKNYTFQVLDRGTIGVTSELGVKWEDDKGNEGELDFGVNYQPGDAIPFDLGLSLMLGEGELLAGDKFEISATTATVREAKDLVLRLGATREGGGLEIRRDNNMVEDLIPGLRMEILDSSEEPITISVSDNTEVARESVINFVDAYNTFNATATEVTKFDAATQSAAPLLSDRNVAQMTSEIATTTIRSVPGLPQTDNMLFALGIRIDDKGVMSVDENKLDEKIAENFELVANIFRSNGDSDAPGIAFVGLTDKTQINPEGYDVEVSEVATRGTLTGGTLPSTVLINSSNNAFYLSSGNKRSELIEIREGTYTPATLAREIQSRLRQDRVLGTRSIRVEAKEGGLQFISDIYGSKSTLEIEVGEEKSLSGLGLGMYDAKTGEDVVGTIDGTEATGRGQLLVGADGGEAEGLRLFVTLPEDQIKTGESEANVVVTKGIAVQLKDILRRITDPAGGDLKQVTNDLSEQLRSYDKQIKTLNERISNKQESLQIKFAKLDSTMGRLKAQQSYLTQQLSALNGSGKEKK